MSVIGSAVLGGHGITPFAGIARNDRRLPRPVTRTASTALYVGDSMASHSSLCVHAAPASCVLVGQAPKLSWDDRGLPFGEPTPLYIELASNNAFMYVDAGAAVEDANGGYLPSLRSWDTLHFSPEGAARYGYAIGEFLTTITG